MRKLKLYSIENDGIYNNYEFNKDHKVMEGLILIFKEVFGLHWFLSDHYKYKNGKWSEGNININKLTDEKLGHCNSKVKVNIFLGKQKMFVIILCSQKLRLKFNEALAQISYMPKVKKLKIKNETIPKIPRKNKKR